MKVRIKKLVSEAIVPSYKHPTDAGMDLTAVSLEVNNGVYTYGTGLALEIPEGYVGLIFPRSSNFKQTLSLTNCVGVIDSGYRGEVKFVFKKPKTEEDNDTIWKIGERVGQIIIMPYPKIEFEEVDNLEASDRGEGGFGSTGK